MKKALKSLFAICLLNLLSLPYIIKTTFAQNEINEVNVTYEINVNNNVIAVTLKENVFDNFINNGRINIRSYDIVSQKNSNFKVPDNLYFIGWKYKESLINGSNVTKTDAYKKGDHFTQDEYYSISDGESSVTLEAVYGHKVFVDGTNGIDDADGLSSTIKYICREDDGAYQKDEVLDFEAFNNSYSNNEVDINKWKITGPVRTLGRAYEVLARLESGNNNANITGFSVNGDSLNGYTYNASDESNYVNNYNGMIVVVGATNYKDSNEGRYKYITYGDLKNADGFASGTVVFNDGVYDETISGLSSITGYSDNDPVKLQRNSNNKYTAKSKNLSGSYHYLLKKELNSYSYEVGNITYYTYGRMTQYTENLRAHVGKGLMTPKNEGLVLITSNDGTDYKSGSYLEFGDYTRYASGEDMIFKNINLRFYRGYDRKQSDASLPYDVENAIYVEGYAANGYYLAIDEGVTVEKPNSLYLYPNIYGGGHAYRYNSLNYSGQNGNKLGDSGPGSIKNTRLTIKSGTYNNIMAGSYGQYVGDVVATYGKKENNAAVVNVFGGTSSGVGAGHEGSSAYNTYIYVYGGKHTTVHGSGLGSTGAMVGGGASNVLIDVDSTISSVYGGSTNGGHKGDANIYIKNGTITTLYGGNSSTDVTGNISINIYGGVIGNLNGGCATGNVNGDININMYGGTINNSFYTSGLGNTKTSSSALYNSADTMIFDDNDPRLNLLISGDISKDAEAITGYTSLVNRDYYNDTTFTLNGNVYYYPHVYTKDYNYVVSGYSNGTYSQNGVVQKTMVRSVSELSLATVNSTNLNVMGGTINCDIFGGGKVSTVDGNVTMKFSNATINGNIYGGGDGTYEPTVILYFPISQNKATTQTFTWKGSDTFKIEEYDISNNVPIDYENKYIYSPKYDYMGGINGNVAIDISNSTINGDVYGGGNAGKVFGNTTLKVLNSSVSGNVIGGGNNGSVSGSTKVIVTDTTINGSLYGGGNSANVYGNTNLTIDGNSKIDIAVFGGGNSGAIGTKENNNSVSTVNIVGGTIGDTSITDNSVVGNVYGGCNTSVVYGNTYVKVGKNAVNNNNLVPADIDIKGTVFGGGEANSSGSSTYDFSFISVTKGTDILIDAKDHSNFNIRKSIFGSGNASSTSGTSSIKIQNYGSKDNVKQNVSIQRADEVLLKNSYIDLEGTVDSTNRYATEVFSISRIDDFKIQDSYIFLQNSTNLLKKWTSLANDGTKATKESTPNKVYIASGKNMKVTTSEDASTFGTVSGITFMGIYDNSSGNRKMGIYDYDSPADDVKLSGVYIIGAQTTDYEVDGFTSNYKNETISLKTVNPLTSGLSYVWRVGSNSTVKDITLTASSFATVGKYVSVDLLDSAPATEYTISSIDYSGLSSGVKVVDPNSIKKVADTKEIANSQIGLSVRIKTSNGWSTSGSFELNSDNNYIGDDSFITEYSRATPSIEICLENSANFDRTDTFGTITLSLYGIKQSEIKIEIYEVEINITINPSINTSEGYEASITSGKQYAPFGVSNTIINHESSFSTMYSLTRKRNLYQDTSGLNRVLISDYAFPEKTKIMLLDISDKTNPEEYYYIVGSNHTESSYPFNDFIKLGVTDQTDTYDNSKNYYNNGIYNEQFIVIVDFYDVDATALESVYNNEHFLRIELGNNVDGSTTSINNELITQITYTIMPGDVNFDLDGTNIISNNIRGSENIDINVVVNKEATLYTDTTLTDKKMGLRLSILKEQTDGTYEILKKDKLLNKIITIDNQIYYPDMMGEYYIKMNNDVVSASKTLSIDNSSLNLESGSYKIKIEYFNTYSGLSSGRVLASTELPFTVKDGSYGLKVTTPDSSRVYIQNTNNDLAGNNNISFNIKYSSNLANPNIRLKIYKKALGMTEYSLINASEVFKDKLTMKNENEYVVITSPTESNTLSLNYLDTIGVGTYKYVFMLYDGDDYIGEYPIQIVSIEHS